jgi:ribosomal protein S17E
MGRIKSKLVKRTTHSLLKKKDIFSSNFEENKRTLNNTISSKKIRNKIAGFISRIKKKETKLNN